ncbi:hypothetical protein P344_04715 [Spiroplasma mirum ATCC 29335]|uniref:Helicase n=1 Tax=Spiroplasma mirum ATCC 29335 TaxID=838561 RepID=W0GRD0_9MOLU|nr:MULTISPECIES: DEAD/DEAH box helicase [Spiroplasma]AHF61189.1 ATP-dependent RNA helicase [Spiroplasma mirum ATCC 29335]AHI58265.1 hypothetical protein P344_04715 [Spiroplasma mirum ATCC 29335]AKM53278.1 ATP-dependent RNA helicase [Spiroplasma atrichopogonis]
MNNFIDFGLKKFLMTGITDLGFDSPTPVQQQVIPYLLKYQNVICKSHTGTGKTHTFILPILNNLDYNSSALQSVIVAPTRELAKQIYENIRFFKTYNPALRTGYYIGGEDINRQIDQLTKHQPQIIVATPTRLKDLFNHQALNFGKLKTFIIDECDMIFDLGFIEDVDFVLSKVSPDVKISVFSATIAPGLRPFLLKYLTNPHLIEINDNLATNQNIEHILIPTKHQERSSVLLKLLATLNPYLCIIFVNKKEMIEQYYDLLLKNNYQVTQLHAGLAPRTRMQTIKRIKNLEFKYIIASDIAARGIDLDGVSHVISIDLPTDLEYYIHRSGRTGRANYHGYSYVLYDTKNLNLVKQLKSKGIEFQVMKWRGNDLVVANLTPMAKKSTSEPNHEINKIINKYPTKNNQKKVKPGYKKKRKAEIAELKRKTRGEHIKASIKKIKKQKAKQRSLKLYDK